MKRTLIYSAVLLLLSVQFCLARIANPYPIALIRQGDIYLIEKKGQIKQLTDFGDVEDLCWLDDETICFSRQMQTGLQDSRIWRGFMTFWDLFLTDKNGSITQFTAHHYARGPSPAAMPGRALFWRDNRQLGTTCEIWETIHPTRRERPLGIQGTTPDAAPNQRWTAASLGVDIPEGIGLYRYPTNDSYKKLRGPYRRPRFAPHSELLAYLNEEADKPEIWGFDIPDGEPRRLLGLGDQIKNIVDFGWAKDGSGYILVLQDLDDRIDVYYWEIEHKILHKITETGDIQSATSWH